MELSNSELICRQLLNQGRCLQYAKAKENESIIQAAGFTIQFEGLTFLDGKDDEFNPLFPPPVHSTVDDYNFRKECLGEFYSRDGLAYCDLPTSTWVQLPSLRWQRVD